jgi:hypothetical protein
MSVSGPQRPRSSTRTGTQIGGAAALLGSLAYISTAVTSQNLSSREAFLLPVGITGCVVATFGVAVLVVFLPHAVGELPGVAVGLATTALVFTAVVAWVQGTVVVGIASHTEDSVFDDIGASAGLTVFFLPKALLGFIGFGALAVAGWRSRTFERRVAALLGIGAMLYLLPPYPPGLVVVSAALLASVRRRRDDSVGDTGFEPVTSSV